MKIADILKTKATISFEVFPPKKDGDLDSIYKTIDALAELNPDFISVTYGALGNTKGKTVEIASKIKNEYGIESVAHLTCISSSKDEVIEMCKAFKENNVENILALRGDFPKDVQFDKNNMGFHYAYELNALIHEAFPNTFCVSGACYPEVHPEATCFEDDLKALKAKVDAGAEYLVTQLFYDNNYYYRLVKEARKIGIKVPILAGIMPVVNTVIYNNHDGQITYVNTIDFHLKENQFKMKIIF